MKKKFRLLSLIFFVSINILTLASCTNKQEQFLEITNDDIYDDPPETGKINKIVKMFIFADPKKTACGTNNFSYWDWNLENRKKIIGSNQCSSGNIALEIWTITLQKTKDKGVYVSDWKKEIKG